MSNGKIEHQLLYKLKVYQIYQVTRPNLPCYKLTQTSQVPFLSSDAVMPLLCILILTTVLSILHASSMAIT
jgi:hypothetical protein